MNIDFIVTTRTTSFITHESRNSIEEAFEALVRRCFGEEFESKMVLSKYGNKIHIGENGEEGYATFEGTTRSVDFIYEDDLKVFKDQDITWGEMREKIREDYENNVYKPF